MDSNQKVKVRVKKEFSEYLDFRNLRKTKERLAILDQIYNYNDYFDVEMLRQSMNKTAIPVSRATLYNTIELLLDCGLLIRHQFGQNMVRYERAYGYENKNHLICTTCGEIREIDSSDLLSPSMRKGIKRFTISYYSMYIYGICSKCAFAKKMAMSKANVNEDGNTVKKT